jgi:hypothetical protein
MLGSKDSEIYTPPLKCFVVPHPRFVPNWATMRGPMDLALACVACRVIAHVVLCWLRCFRKQLFTNIFEQFC